MKRAVAFLLVVLALAMPGAAQERFSLRLSGRGGMGYNWSNTSSGQYDSTFRDLGTDLELDASGFLYDPRLITYSSTFGWTRANTAVDQAGSSSNGLSFNTNIGFVTERSFPVSFFMSRSTTSADSDFFPLYQTTTSQWGVRGSYRGNKRLGLLNYTFTDGGVVNELPDGSQASSDHRNANLSWSRNLFGWAARANYDLSWTTSRTGADYEHNMRTLTSDASRAFGKTVRVDLTLVHSSFGFHDEQVDSRSGVLSVNANASWDPTEKLSTYYGAGFSRNALNSLRILEDTSGIPNPLPFNPVSTSSSSQSAVAGATYRITSALSFNGNASYSHNDLDVPPTIDPEVQAAVVTGTVAVNGGYSYTRKLWRLRYYSRGSVSSQRFMLLSGANPGTALGYSLDNGVSGGDPRRISYSMGYRFARRNSPVFFNAATSADRALNYSVDTQRLKWFALQFAGENVQSELELLNSRLNMDRSSYRVTLSRPKLNIYGMVTQSDSSEAFFRSVVLSGSRAAGAAETDSARAPIYDPWVVTELSGMRAGVMWRPRNDFELEGRYSDTTYLFLRTGVIENGYAHFDVLGRYKWGRFTFIVGYGHLLTDAPTVQQQTDRIFFRIRFPFRVM